MSLLFACIMGKEKTPKMFYKNGTKKQEDQIDNDLI